MAHRFKKALTKYWAGNWKALELVLWAAGYKFSGNGIESGWSKEDHGFWFCDDGTIEYYELPESER